ncbi:exopolyphosphatase / guanosine-5'-triphosphate,3'-diphosphate pyrophosphatase [Arboricoccus pini]|uniref:Exopolyphosphatase / guanosine-5'-triphosphate,3'-diphosphate pyrophosphatase n=1 Tax=Arboricoccus pini TaxID=1963835 RepID=A0A212QRB4_9PROT|nr:Ppx/GppA phosphatase family protein [Arboricoccus pini]SNB62129.1 exopolyphosphatase / guanosine-5'-triphosphate,3'-diphosphate pyrophosphatase [Arboricoccus pini]
MDTLLADPKRIGDSSPPPSRLPAQNERLAALDLGTNNCRLLVAEVRNGDFVVIDSFSRIVRLGEGLAHSDRLSSAAMSRTIAALKVCARIIERNRATHVRCVTTEACRRAVNGAAFISRVQGTVGLSFEILDQDEEARLAMLGCLPLVDSRAERLLMLDIGGGSSEVMYLDRRASADGRQQGLTASLPVGVVTLSETHAQSPAEMAGLWQPAAFERMVADVAMRLDQATASWPDLDEAEGWQMLGTSGTVTTLAALHLGLKRYDRRRVDGMWLSFAAIDKAAAELRDLDDHARALHPCIGQGRADLVVAGCAILEAIRRRWPVMSLRVADRGLREGILGTLMGQNLQSALLPSGVAVR